MIYFITARDIGRVKIGFSKDPQKRLAQLQGHTSCPAKLELEFAIEGDTAEEKALHRRFAEYRERGEWFRISPEIENFIQGHQPKPKYEGFQQNEQVGPFRFDPEGWLHAHQGRCDDMPKGVADWLRFRAGEFALQDEAA